MSEDFASDGFRAGFVPRHHAAADRLQQAFAPGPRAFAAVPVGAGATPRHFDPADRDDNPTAGWNPLDPNAPTSRFVDPVATAHAAGFVEGEAAAIATLAERTAADRALLTGLAAALTDGHAIDRDKLAAQLRRTVLHLVAKLVGETGVSADLLAARVGAATDLLADAAESALLRLNPADVSLIEGRLPVTIFAAGDAAVPRGSFVLESASTVVEDGPDLWLDQLTAAIERAAVPSSSPSC